MSNWEYMIDFSDLCKKKDEDEITLDELSSECVRRIREFANIKLTGDEQYDLLQIAQDMENIIGEGDDEFDFALGSLYDWGDQVVPKRLFDNENISTKMCWIKTF